MSTVAKKLFTPDEYLERERKAEYKSEYYKGEVFAMAGASEAHNLIVSNVIASLVNQLRGRRCRVYPGDMRVKVRSTGLYTYPDVAVVCDKPEFDDSSVDTLLNPVLLIEVLSNSTASYDRGKKFELYRKLDSFEQYVLIEQDHPHIDVYTKEANGKWALTDADGLDASIPLSRIDCTLVLREVYDKVEFPEPNLRSAE